MEVTIQDIADQLDVSPATVSRSLRQDTLVHPETRARVNEAAERLGYKLRIRRPRRIEEPCTNMRTLGLVLRLNSLDAARHDTNLMKMMAGIMAVADSSQTTLQIHTIHHEEKRLMADDPAVVPAMIKSGVCHALIVHGNQDERDVAFLAGRAPVVSMGRLYGDLPIDAAVGDNVEGVRKMVAQLVKLGHRRLAWVGTGIPAYFMDARQAGFIQGCVHHGLDLTAHSFLGPDFHGGPNSRNQEVVSTVLNSGITGFVCGNDYVAHRVIDVLEERGRSVPDDCSVTGFDAALDPARTVQLTSVDPDFFEIGRVAAQLAIQRIAQPSAKPCIVNVRGDIVQGGTTAPPRSATVVGS